MRRMIVWALVLGLGGVACSDSNSPAGGNPGPNQVFMQGTAFNPTTRTVASGTLVTWVNQDGLLHTLTSSSVPATAATFNSNVASGASVPITFTVVGTYQYYCTIHGTPTTGMHATLIVN